LNINSFFPIVLPTFLLNKSNCFRTPFCDNWELAIKIETNRQKLKGFDAKIDMSRYVF